jgi:hypothetical protein
MINTICIDNIQSNTQYVVVKLCSFDNRMQNNDRDDLDIDSNIVKLNSDNDKPIAPAMVNCSVLD